MPRYEFVEGKSRKFWEITLEGKAFTTRWGRLGAEGQSATKTFPNAAAAKTEYEKLVAEKVKKGYQLAGGAKEKTAADSGAGTPPPGRPAPAESSRQDVYVYNEATGFVLTSASLKGRGLEDEAWDRAVAGGDLFPIELVQDDSFIIRVVLNGEMEPREEQEWVGRLAWHLRVPDGRLAISAGGEFIIEDFEDFVHYLDVPAGDYRAVLYAYLNGVNGEHLLGLATPGQEPEPVGKYFRRTRGDREFPDWLQDWCTAYSDKDPGHEEEWQGRKPLEAPARFVGFLLHLTPLGKVPKATPKLVQGFFAWNSFEARQPKLCPLGLPARDVVDLPEKKADQPWVFQPVDVAARVEAYAPAPLEGGPVEVPLEKLGRVYRLVWFAYDSSDVEVRITLPPGAAFSPKGEAPKGVVYQPGEGALRVGFAETGAKWATLYSVERVGPQIAELPDHSVVEMLCAPEELEAGERTVGLYRFRGPVAGGTWRISEAFPAAPAERLRAALALSAEVESQQRITVLSDQEADTILERATKEYGFFYEKNPLSKEAGALRLEKPDGPAMCIVGAFAYRVRFADTWPMPPEEDEFDLTKLFQ